MVTEGRERIGRGGGMLREFGVDMYTLPGFKWITNKDLVCGSTSCGSRMGGEFGGEWTHVHVRLSPFVLCLKLSQHCSSTKPQRQLKSLKVLFPPPTSPPPSLFFCQFLDDTIDYSAWIRHPGSILNPPSAAPTISMDPHT